MTIKLSWPKAKFLPVIFLFLVFNLAPLFLVVSKYIDLNSWKSSTNELIISIALFLITYGLNYLLASYYFSRQTKPYKSELIQSVLHIFAISRTAIVLIPLSLLVFIMELNYQILLLILLGLEVLLFVYHYIVRRIKIKS